MICQQIEIISLTASQIEWECSPILQRLSANGEKAGDNNRFQQVFYIRRNLEDQGAVIV